MLTTFLEELSNTFTNESLLLNEPMKNHTSFKVGGPVDCMIIPKNEAELSTAISLLKKNNIDYFIMGNGSNLLVTDKGIRSCVIKISNNFKSIQLENNVITAGSGTLLSAIANFALDNNLGGFEFASGIPGTLGGAISMNAGAYEGEMKNVIEEVTVMDQNGTIKTLSNNQLNFSYRHSVIQEENLIVLSGKILLSETQKEEISAKMKDFNGRRKEKQPLEFPSAGSTFKRPANNFAGKLIMDSGLKNYKIGGAIVSPKHCGFIVNDGTATASDILNLMEFVQQKVKEEYNVLLEPEVKILGEI